MPNLTQQQKTALFVAGSVVIVVLVAIFLWPQSGVGPSGNLPQQQEQPEVVTQPYTYENKELALSFMYPEGYESEVRKYFNASGQPDEPNVVVVVRASGTYLDLFKVNIHILPAGAALDDYTALGAVLKPDNSVALVFKYDTQDSAANTVYNKVTETLSWQTTNP